MGAKTWMLAYVDGDATAILKSGPRLNRAAADALLAQLFPAEKWEKMEDTDLSWTCPAGNEIFIRFVPRNPVLQGGE
jgi:hypothetical protein